MALNGETFQDRSKGKDVRTSNILAAKVRFVDEHLVFFCIVHSHDLFSF